MSERRERSALAAERNIHRTEVGDDRNSGSAGDDSGLAELQCRGDLPARRAAGRQMEKCMAVRSDEGDVGKRDACAARDLDCGASKLAAEREVERRNRSGANFLIGGSVEQFFTKARRVRESLKRDQPRGRTRTLIELDHRRAHAVVRRPGHQADGQHLAALESNRDWAHLCPRPDRQIRFRCRPDRPDDLNEVLRIPQGADAIRRENRASVNRRAIRAR